MTIVINGIEINVIDPPKPDLAIPYKIIAGTTVKKNNRIYFHLFNEFNNFRSQWTNWFLKYNLFTCFFLY